MTRADLDNGSNRSATAIKVAAQFLRFFHWARDGPEQATSRSRRRAQGLPEHCSVGAARPGRILSTTLGIGSREEIDLQLIRKNDADARKCQKQLWARG